MEKIKGIGWLGIKGYDEIKPLYNKRFKYPQNEISECTKWINNNKGNKCAIIIGGGVNGICNAFELNKKGYKLAIIDKNNDIATECSYATWGGMSTNYGYVKKTKLKQKSNNYNTPKDKYNNFVSIYLNWNKILFDPHFLRWGYNFMLHRSQILNKR